jgi:hypothetical protein
LLREGKDIKVKIINERLYSRPFKNTEFVVVLAALLIRLVFAAGPYS